MNFDHFREWSDYGESHDVIRLGEVRSVPRRLTCFELVATMTSQRKIEANRRNAKQSTGPKTEDGKARARFNALKHGLFAIERLLPGEDEEHYEAVQGRLVEELQPRTTIEELIVDQIVRDTWQLMRLEWVEQEYFDRAKKGALQRLIASLNDDERRIAENVLNTVDKDGLESEQYSDRLRRFSFGARENLRKGKSPDSPEAKEAKLAAFMADRFASVTDVPGALLEGMLPNVGHTPYTALEHMHQSLLRNLLKKYAALRQMQADRLTIVSGKED